MPSYSQRGQRFCPKCKCNMSGEKCQICGGETQCEGSWSVRFRVLEGGRFVNKRLSGFETREDAELAYTDYIGMGISGRTFFDLFEDYISKVSRSLKGATIYNKRNIFNRYILPFMGGMKMCDIDKAFIIQWRDGLLSRESAKSGRLLSIKYINNIRAELCTFFSYLEEYYDYSNFIKSIKPLKKNNEEMKEMSFYDIAEFKKLLRAIRRTSNLRMRLLYDAFFSMLYYSGARVGEVLALSEYDINLETGVLNINKSLTRKTPRGVPYKITTPKNLASIRRIIMPRALIESLRRYIDFKRTNNISTQFLFGGEKPLNSYSYARALKKYAERAKIKVIRIHDFRHSHASLLINLGANITLVSKRLGHANTQQTLNTYSHLFPSTEGELIKLLNRI